MIDYDDNDDDDHDGVGDDDARGVYLENRSIQESFIISRYWLRAKDGKNFI